MLRQLSSSGLLGVGVCFNDSVFSIQVDGLLLFDKLFVVSLSYLFQIICFYFSSIISYSFFACLGVEPFSLLLPEALFEFDCEFGVLVLQGAMVVCESLWTAGLGLYLCPKRVCLILLALGVDLPMDDLLLSEQVSLIFDSPMLISSCLPAW